MGTLSSGTTEQPSPAMPGILLEMVALILQTKRLEKFCHPAVPQLS
jgi:hypothetical protein